MADKTKLEGIGAKRFNPKRTSMATGGTTSRDKIYLKHKTPATRPKKTNLDSTVLKQEPSLSEFDEDLQFAYGRFMRDMLERCLIDEKIQREETTFELLMTKLAERFRKTMDQLNKTNKRLKDISFVLEQKRLLDLKIKDSTQFCNMTEDSSTETLLQDLSTAEQQCLDKIKLHNVDFGYDKDTGHKELLKAVNETIEGLEMIKKESNLDMHRFQEYDRSKQGIEVIQKDRFDLESLKSVFEAEFPRMSERLLQEASEKIAKMIENDDVDESDDDQDNS